MIKILKLPLKALLKTYREAKKLSKRLFYRPKWKNMRGLKPISNVFGFDRGTPIDRIYTDDFLQKNCKDIKGIVCEIAESTYTKRWGGGQVSKSEILHFTSDNANATIVGDLTQYHLLAQNYLDCFICTVTLNFIYDYKEAIKGIHSMLKPGGVALITVAGLIQISRYDYDRWGDYHRFTDMGIKKDFEEIFTGNNNVEVFSYGNVLAAIAELQGISAEELTKEELFYNDNDYQVLITIKATKA